MQAAFHFVQLFKQLVLLHLNSPEQSEEDLLRKLKIEYSKGFQRVCKIHFQICIKQIFSIVQNSQGIIKQSLARLLINKFFLLKKSLSQILEEGILTLYIQLFEIQESLIKKRKNQLQEQILAKIIQAIQPLLFRHFMYKEFLRRKKILLELGEFYPQKEKSLVKKGSKISDYSQQSSQKQYQQLNLCQGDQNLINVIKQQFKSKCLHELLEEYLKSETKDMDQMIELCRICSKNVRLADLQKHVVYCQKKIFLKQQITKFTKILDSIFCDIKKSLNQQMTVRQTSNQNNSRQQSQQTKKIKAIVKKLDGFHKQLDIKKKQKHWTSNYKIKQSGDQIIEIQEDLASHEMKFGSSNLIEQINHYLVIERDISMLCKQISQVQEQYKNIRQIKSITTIHSRSQNSANKISKGDKKSKFAQSKLKQLSVYSINVQNKQNDEPSDQSLQIINLDGGSIYNLSPSLKTKNSLGATKIVHFNFDQSDQITSQSAANQDDQSRNFKSLCNFDSIINLNDNDASESQSQSKQVSQLSLADFQILKFIGKGAFGKVFAARRKSTLDLYALKIVNIDQKWGQEELSSIVNQHEVFQKIQGDHLVRAPFSFSQGSTQIFMMEFMPGGDLSKLLEEQCYFQEEKAKFYLAEIVLAIEHLHKFQIIHRDLKPQNLVFDQNGHLKLTDFGLSQFQIKGKLQKVFKIASEQQFKVARRRQRRTAVIPNKSQAKLIGTPDYIAPEIINGISIDNKSIDWWSLGIIAYELMVGTRPFCGNTLQQVINNIRKFLIEWPDIGNEDGCISENAFDLIQKLLNRDFMNRIGAKNVNQIKRHQFFDGIDWENIKNTKAPYIPQQNVIKKILQMQEDTMLRQQVQLMIRSNRKNSKLKLQNFVRYDILGQQTMDCGKKSRSLKGHTLKKLENIKRSINNELSDNQLETIPDIRKLKKHKSYFQIHSRQSFDE